MSHLTQKERQQVALEYYQKGLQYKSDHDETKALRFFKRTLEADSTFINAYVDIAEIMILRKEYQEAENFLMDVPDAIKPDSRIYYLIGSAQFYQKKINESVQNLEKTIQIQPNRAEASWMLARLYYQLENYEHSFEHLEKLLRDSLFVDYEKIVALHQKVNAILNNFNPKSSFEKKVYQAVNQSNKVSRGQFALVLIVEFRGLYSAALTNIHFADVKEGDPLADYYKKAVEIGILEALPDGKFYPEYVMRRRNLAYYLQRLLVEKNAKLFQSEKGIVLTDVDRNDLQFDAIRSVCSLQIMSLQQNGKFNPDEPISGRELSESVSAVKRLLESR